MLKKNLSILILSYIFIHITSVLHGQVIYTSPVFPLETDSVYVYFDATKGTGGLKGYTGDVYAHTGVITNLSQSTTDWKYVKTSWGTNTSATLLERIGQDLYRLKIQPTVRQYYNVPANEQILQMAFVFRSAQPVGGNYLEGKDNGGTDLYVNIYAPGLQVMIHKPPAGYILMAETDSLKIEAHTTNDADSLRLFVDGMLIRSDTLSALIYWYHPQSEGEYYVIAEAWQGGNSIYDTLVVYVYGHPVSEPLPPGVRDGINIISPTEVVLVLYAPMKQMVHAIGDFNNWRPGPDAMMRKTPVGSQFWIRLTQLIPGKDYIYQYLVDASIRIGDPYAHLVADPWNDPYINQSWVPVYPYNKTTGIATVFNTTPEPYVWKSTGFTPPPPEDLVIYELLVRDFTAAHSFRGVIDTLGYLVRLGINAIKLLPVNEFEGNSSWGYNPNYYFATDKYYGTANDLKALIDTCHQLGIAVILDVVYNHSFGSSPYVLLYWDAANNRPAPYSPFYNPVAKHDYNVGYDFNHESQATQRYISRALKFWLEEFRVDGFRFDLSKGFTQKNTLGNVAAWGAYDATRINLLQMYADTVWSVNPNAYVIMEHFADNDEEKELSDRGMLLWGNMNHQYAEAAMGYHGGGKSNLSWGYYKVRGWNDPHLISYMESHDEERILYKCLEWGNYSTGYQVKELSTGLARLQANAALFFTIPGPKMVWQFGELGYDYTINYNGRTGEKPIRWDYYTVPERRALYDTYAGLLHLRSLDEVFRIGSMSYNLSGAVKHLVLRSGGLQAVVVGNFDVVRLPVAPGFPSTGVWYDYFSGDSIQVEDTAMTLSLAPGQYHVFLTEPWVTPYPVKPEWKTTTGSSSGLGLVFPNPTEGDLNLLWNTETADPLRVDVFDAMGRMVGSAELSASGGGVISLREIGASLNTGLYFFRFSSGENREVHKVVIY